VNPGATTVAETVDCWGFTISLAIADLVLTPGASGTEQTLASTTAVVPVSLASVDLSSEPITARSL